MDKLFSKLHFDRATNFDKFVLMPVVIIAIVTLTYDNHGFYESMVSLIIMGVGLLVMFEMDEILDTTKHPKLELFMNLQGGNGKQRIWYLFFYTIMYIFAFSLTILFLPIKLLDLSIKGYKKLKRGS